MRKVLTLLGAFMTILLTHAIGHAQPNRWKIPTTAMEEKNPLPRTPEVLNKGKSVYSSHCQRCHGPEGMGDGPDAEPEPTADLTDGFRTSINPDGVVFYKIWNGRRRLIQPGMPAFSSSLSKDEVWAVVMYVQTLRKPE